MITRVRVSLRELAARVLADKRRVLYGGAAAATLLVVTLVYLGTRPPRPANVVLVRRGRITANVEASGQVRPAREAWLSLRSDGAIKSVLVKPGQQVKAGDILVQADSSLVENQLREAEVNLQIRQIQYDELKSAPTSSQIEIARAGLRRAAAVLQAAQSTYDRVAKGGKAAGSSEAAALESAKLDYETARASFEQATSGPTADQIQIADKNLELARLAVEAARSRLDSCTITAPFAGTVVQVSVREGESAYGVQAVRLADLGTLEVVAQVDELDIGELVVGQEAQIHLDALPGQVLEGRLARITPGATPQRGTVGYEVAITFSPGQAPVRPDMTANLSITTLTHDDTLLVPGRAVESRGRNKYVRVLEGGRTRDVRVVTGLSDAEDTEILEGLREGQQVLVQ